MSRIGLSPELLNIPADKVNVCNFYNPLEDLSATLSSACEMEIDYHYTETGEEPEVDADGRAFLTEAMSQWQYFLEDRFDELFGDNAPVRLWGPGEIYFDDGGWGYSRDSYTMSWSVDGEALFKLAESYGITSVDDGHGISGFVRTCDDATWARHRVISELMEAMSDTIFFDIYEDFWELATDYVHVKEIAA